MVEQYGLKVVLELAIGNLEKVKKQIARSLESVNVAMTSASRSASSGTSRDGDKIVQTIRDRMKEIKKEIANSSSVSEIKTLVKEEQKLKSELKDLLDPKEKNKEGNGMLALIFKRLAPIAILLSIKPVLDTIGLFTNLAFYALLKVAKFFNNIGDTISNAVVKGITQWLTGKDGDPAKKEEQKIEPNFSSKTGGAVAVTPAGKVIKNDHLVEDSTGALGNFLITLGKFDPIFGKLDTLLGNTIISVGKSNPQIGNFNPFSGIAKFFDPFGAAGTAIGAGLNLGSKLSANLQGSDKEGDKKNLQDIKTSTQKTTEQTMKANEKSDALRSSFLATGLKTVFALLSLPNPIGKSVASNLNSFLDQLVATIIKNTKSDTKDKKPTTTKKVGDAILRPDGSVIETDPNDTLIATKTPGRSGGVTVVVQAPIYGMTPEDLVRRIERSLGRNVFASGSRM